MNMALNSAILSMWKEPTTTLQKLFKLSAKNAPENLALVAPNIALTYAELDSLSDDFAVYLQKNGATKTSKIVGVYLEKSYEYILACLSILKAEAAYLHLDTEYSFEVLSKIINDTVPAIIITRRKYMDKIPANTSTLIFIDEKNDWNPDHQPVASSPSMSAEVTAFIGYTSGTTGVPKGVNVSHLSAAYSMSKFWEEVLPYEHIMNFGYATYLSWDAISPLLFGATAHIIPDNIANDPLMLVEYIKKTEINHIFLTPSLLKNLFQKVSSDILKDKLVNLSVIWIGGEVTTGELVERVYAILPNTHLINNYGPSECFVVTQGELTKEDANLTLCPAGRVLPEMDVLILDQKGNDVPDGLPGELYVKGPCLAEGYINNAQLTQEKFLDIKGAKYFKTGDLASFMTDGRLIIHGRADYFIKIGNQEVNLLEIQEKIRKSLHVTNCIVVGKEDTESNTYLICFYVDANIKIETNDAVRTLSTTLPKSLIPREYHKIDTIPISSTSQKLNYKLLKNNK